MSCTACPCHRGGREGTPRTLQLSLLSSLMPMAKTATDPRKCSVVAVPLIYASYHFFSLGEGLILMVSELLFGFYEKATQTSPIKCTGVTVGNYTSSFSPISRLHRGSEPMTRYLSTYPGRQAGTQVYLNRWSMCCRQSRVRTHMCSVPCCPMQKCISNASTRAAEARGTCSGVCSTRSAPRELGLARFN